MPPGRQAVVARALALHADEVAPEIVGALEAQGLHPAEQISLCWLHRRRAGSDAGDAIKLAPRYASRGAEIRRAAGAASPTADAAKRRCAGRDDAAARFFPVRRLRNLFLLSAHGHESNYACARGREGNEAFISRRLSRRILALTLQLTILPAQ
jgi:hypothetical protein